MNSITQVIRKVATAVRKAVLLGALVGSVSMIANATEVTETNVGPTIEKAQLETAHINLEAVVAAITKVDPDWVKGLPKLAGSKINAMTPLYWYEVDANGETIAGHLGQQRTKEAMIEDGDCKDETEEICLFGSTSPNVPGGQDVTDADESQLIRKSTL